MIRSNRHKKAIRFRIAFFMLISLNKGDLQ
jgi:hypothetical protein